MRTMCTYEHGIRDRVKVIRDYDANDFNRELQRSMSCGWRLIQPIETFIAQEGRGYGKVYHIAVLAAPMEDDGL